MGNLEDYSELGFDGGIQWLFGDTAEGTAKSVQTITGRKYLDSQLLV